jgi:hypothetical protein
MENQETGLPEPEDQRPKSILLNWVLVALGCASVAGLAVLLPELM